MVQRHDAACISATCESLPALTQRRCVAVRKCVERTHARSRWIRYTPRGVYFILFLFFGRHSCAAAARPRCGDSCGLGWNVRLRSAISSRTGAVTVVGWVGTFVLGWPSVLEQCGFANPNDQFRLPNVPTQAVTLMFGLHYGMHI